MPRAEIHPLLRQLKGRRVAFVASTGGHLEQAVRWSERLQVAEDSIFITFRTPQSIGLLVGRQRVFVNYIPPRTFLPILNAGIDIAKFLASPAGQVDAIISTGASIAVSAYIPTLLRGGALHYIESISRFYGPSLTGKVLARLPRIHAFTQHPRYASRRWKRTAGLLDGWAPETIDDRRQTDSGIKIFVTLGTIQPYQFKSVVRAVRDCISTSDEVVWQLGVTIEEGLPGTVFDFVSSHEFDKYATDADVVVTHAGVGSLMRLFDLGVSPIAVPRRAQRGEHVDDHQVQAAHELGSMGLVTALDPDDLSWNALHARRSRIRKVDA